ncbi:MAG: endonuclease III [Nannocystis sp.]|nr:endonuclease III [Nannocystis sp.]MBA3550276.1 endonuclease III [Nannocystis sp.]
MTTVEIDVLLPRLRELHPTARYELNWSTPVQMLVATILAAQCTDERVNAVTETLFVRYPDAAAFAGADRGELEEAIRQTGFYKQKAKSVQEACQALIADFGGEVPRTVAELVTLPGVARKTANVVLATCFDIPSGIIVDTHVARLSQRMGLSRQRDPDRIEQDLMPLVAEDQWTYFGPAMVLFGRYVCTAKKPACTTCMLQDVCPKIGV